MTHRTTEIDVRPVLVLGIVVYFGFLAWAILRKDKK